MHSAIGRRRTSGRRAVHDRALSRGNVTGGKLDNNTRWRAGAEVKHGLGQFRSRAKNGAVGIGKIDDELSPQVNALAGKSALGDISQVAWADESTERHFPRRKSFPCPAAGG